MKTSYEVLEEIESRIEYLVQHVRWLEKQPSEGDWDLIQQEIFHCTAQINCLKGLWAFIKGE